MLQNCYTCNYCTWKILESAVFSSWKTLQFSFFNPAKSTKNGLWTLCLILIGCLWVIFEVAVWNLYTLDLILLFSCQHQNLRLRNVLVLRLLFFVPSYFPRCTTSVWTQVETSVQWRIQDSWKGGRGRRVALGVVWGGVPLGWGLGRGCALSQKKNRNFALVHFCVF